MMHPWRDVGRWRHGVFGLAREPAAGDRADPPAADGAHAPAGPALGTAADRLATDLRAAPDADGDDRATAARHAARRAARGA